ncbi:hypothetical protein PoB_002435000 [Plakobranchus ocellatus]|uniref:Uncharacterized protein n=1 Tax=Plakobranchus ocellatus TaxID=259542 RepID=A0AAV3ZRR5_9GAST|nr:hypothetical protein PoB_002435000 [Plakobranchus ocellatus]
MQDTAVLPSSHRRFRYPGLQPNMQVPLILSHERDPASPDPASHSSYFKMVTYICILFQLGTSGGFEPATERELLMPGRVCQRLRN